MKRIAFLPLFLALLLTGCGAPADGPAGSSAGTASSAPVESIPIPAGEYADGTGDSLTLALREDGSYQVDFGVYKLFWVEDAAGAQEGDVLHVEGTDDGGSPFVADITAEGGGLLLTVAASGHPDCPTEAEFHFTPAE